MRRVLCRPNSGRVGRDRVRHRRRICRCSAPSLLTSTLGAPAAASGSSRGHPTGWPVWLASAGGAAPTTRPSTGVAVGGYTATAVLAAATGAATAVWQVGLLRAGALGRPRSAGTGTQRAARRRGAPGRYGRAYGFERMMDNLGAIGGPLLALGLVAAVGTRWAIGLSVIPGLLAAAAIIYAIRQRPDARPCRGDGRSACASARCCAAGRPLMRRYQRVRGRQRRRDSADPAAPPNCSHPGASADRGGHARVGSTPPTTQPRPVSLPAGRLADRSAPGRVSRRRRRRLRGGLRRPSPSPPASVACSPPRSCSPVSPSGASRPPNTPPSPRSPPPDCAARRSGCSPASRAAATSPPAALPASSGQRSARRGRSPTSHAG